MPTLKYISSNHVTVSGYESKFVRENGNYCTTIPIFAAVGQVSLSRSGLTCPAYIKVKVCGSASSSYERLFTLPVWSLIQTTEPYWAHQFVSWVANIILSIGDWKLNAVLLWPGSLHFSVVLNILEKIDLDLNSIRGTSFTFTLRNLGTVSIMYAYYLCLSVRGSPSIWVLWSFRTDLGEMFSLTAFMFQFSAHWTAAAKDPWNVCSFNAVCDMEKMKAARYCP